jgi:hypothetical protein
MVPTYVSALFQPRSVRFSSLSFLLMVRSMRRHGTDAPWRLEEDIIGYERIFENPVDRTY